MEQSQCLPTPRIYYEVRPHHLPSLEPGRFWVFYFPFGFLSARYEFLQLPNLWKWKLRIVGQLRLKHRQKWVSTMCCISQSLNLSYLFWLQRSARVFDSHRLVSTFHLLKALLMLTLKMINVAQIHGTYRQFSLPLGTQFFHIFFFFFDFFFLNQDCLEEAMCSPCNSYT